MFCLLECLPLPEKDAAVVRALALQWEDESGALTAALCSMEWDETKLRFHLDIRAPAGVGREQIEGRLHPLMERIGAQCKQCTYSAGYHISEDVELVQTLLRVYRDRTGDLRGPVTTCGGTYARQLPNTVGLGLKRPGKDNRLHAADEYVDICDFMEDTKILADAIGALAGAQQR